MKYAIVILGGAADRPMEALGGKTPLQAAKAPALRRMGASGRLGQARMLPDAIEPGPDAAAMALLGYDPMKHYPGQAPLVAAGLGLDQPDGAWAMNLSLLSAPAGTLDTYDDALLPAAEARALIRDLLPALEMPGVSIHPGPGAMHVMIDLAPDEEDPEGGYRDWRTVVAAPPDVIRHQPIREHLPVGDVAGERLQQLIAQSSVALQNHEINTARQEMGEPPITHLWPWGLGLRPALRPWAERFGKSAAILSSDPAVRGLGALAGLEVIDPLAGDSVEGTLIRLSADAVDAINRYELVIVHSNAPQQAGLEGNAADKAHAIQFIDQHLLQPVAQALAARGEHRLMATPLHATCADDARDLTMPVPFVITGYKMAGVVPRTVTEADAEASDLKVPFGHELMEYFLKSGVR